VLGLCVRERQREIESMCVHARKRVKKDLKFLPVCVRVFARACVRLHERLHVCVCFGESVCVMIVSYGT